MAFGQLKYKWLLNIHMMVDLDVFLKQNLYSKYVNMNMLVLILCQLVFR